MKIVWFLSGVLRVKRITEDNREGCAFDKMQDEAIELSYTRRIWNGWLYWHAGPGRYLTGCTLTQSPKPTSLLITEHFTGYWFPISPKMGAAFFTIHLLNIYPNNFTRVKYLMTLGGLYFFFFLFPFFSLNRERVGGGDVFFSPYIFASHTQFCEIEGLYVRRKMGRLIFMVCFE